MVTYPHGQIRAVTHYGIEAADIERTFEAVQRALAAIGAAPAAARVTAARPDPCGRGPGAGATPPEGARVTDSAALARTDDGKRPGPAPRRTPTGSSRRS